MVKKNFIYIVAFFIGVVTLIPAFSKYQELLEKNREVETSIHELARSNKVLYEKQRKMQTDPVYAESVARYKLNVAKEGEVIYKILPRKE